MPVEREERSELARSTGQQSIPALIARRSNRREEEIVSYLNTHFAEPPEAVQQRAKAAKARAKELEKACQDLAAATH